MLIGICDDNKQFRKLLLAKILSAYFHFLEDPPVIIEYSNALELISASDELDLLFLDIMMPEMSGMELMHKYPQQFKRTKVIFLTFYTNYLAEGYEVNAYRYLTKPIQDEKLEEIFNTLKKEETMENELHIISNRLDIPITFSDIIYIEARNNFCDIITTTQTWKCYKRLKDLQPQLPEEYFYSPHRSYIVNLTQIKQLDSKEKAAHMTNNHTVFISGKQYKKFAELYAVFLAKH